MSATLFRSSCLSLCSPRSATFCGAGKAPGMLCGATVGLVSFSLGTPPLSPFPDVHQGISPVLHLCSQAASCLRNTPFSPNMC